MIRNYYHQVTSKFPYHLSWLRCIPLLWSSLGEDKLFQACFQLAQMIRNYCQQVTNKFPNYLSWLRCISLLWSSPGEDKISEASFLLVQMIRMYYQQVTNKFPYHFSWKRCIPFRDHYFEVHLVKTKCLRHLFNCIKWLKITNTK